MRSVLIERASVSTLGPYCQNFVFNILLKEQVHTVCFTDTTCVLYNIYNDSSDFKFFCFFLVNYQLYYNRI